MTIILSFRPPSRNLRHLDPMRVHMKKIIIGLIILALLVAGWLFVRQSTYQQKTTSSLSSSLWNSFTWDNVTSLTIGTTTFKKENDLWQVQKNGAWYPAQKNVLDQIASFFVDITIQQRVAQTSQKHTELEVTDGIGIGVRIANDNNPFAEFIVGKSGFDYSSCYLRLKNQDTVYLVSPNCRFTFDHTEWRDLRIAPNVNASDIEKITITQNNISRNLAKQEEKLEWKENDTDLDAEKMRDLLVAIIETDATDMIPSNTPSITPEFASPFAKIMLEGKDQSSIIITIGSKVSDKEERYVQGTNKEFIYTVPTSRVDEQWLKSKDALKK